MYDRPEHIKPCLSIKIGIEISVTFSSYRKGKVTIVCQTNRPEKKLNKVGKGFMTYL